MTLKDISFPTPRENILFDEVLFQCADQHGAGEFLRFWESPVVFIVLGRIGKAQEDVHCAKAAADGIAVLRRFSGGGTVVQGPGCLNYTLILSKEQHPQLRDLRKSYEWVGAKVVDALRACGAEAYFRPISDLAVGGDERKCSGNAQYRGRRHILHHGTILYNFDLTLMARYLKIPKEIPQYRKGRPHADFVVNIPVNPSAFKPCFAKIFGLLATPQPATDQELSLLHDFLKQ